MWTNDTYVDINDTEGMTDVEKEIFYFERLPLFVSIPRSGCNWVQSAMEIYFDRHRVMKAPNSPSWLETPVQNPLWMHAHDVFYDAVDVKTDNPVIFLHRDPVDVMYSFVQLFKNGSQQSIAGWCTKYKKLYDKWMLEENKSLRGDCNVLALNYDDVIADKHGAMKLISEHLNIPFDLKRSEHAFELIGNKKNINEKNGINRNFKNPDSGTKEYESVRPKFRETWESYILEHTLPQKENELNDEDFWDSI